MKLLRDRWLRVHCVLSLLALASCGVDSALVGGRCADGLEQEGSTCVGPGFTLITPGDPPDGSPDAAFDPGDASGVVDGSAPSQPVTAPPVLDAAPPDVICVKPLAACRGACIPMTDDGMNCGACGKTCPSNICVGGECQGATPGDVVLIGHDFTAAATGSAQAKVLMNALSIPTSDPVRVLSYEVGASAQTVAQTKAIAAGGFYGRKVQFTATQSAGSIASNTLIHDYDIVLLHGATSNDPAALGARWSTSLEAFTKKGGVVIALDNGVSPMPLLLSHTGLLSVDGHAQLPQSTHLVVAAAADVVGAQVLSPYATFGLPVAFQGVDASRTDTTWVVRRDDDAGTGDPVVLHRIVR